MEKNDAAEQFYHTYRSLIFRTAARLCRTQEDLDDLIQDSLLRFLQNLTYYTNRAPDETSALIVLTIRSQNIDTFRRLHPEKWADWEDEAIEVTVSLKREAESRAFRRSEILLLMEALESEDRYLLQSYYIAGTSIRALAKSLHITTSAVHMRLLRAKERAVNRWNLSLEEVMKRKTTKRSKRTSTPPQHGS